jgi:SAM-dependent methyltransferase
MTGDPWFQASYAFHVNLSDSWESYADSWIAWARTQDHDGFWDGTWPELRSVLPSPDEGLVVEIGCGEGRAGRQMIALGYEVVGIERSPTLAGAARRADPPLMVIRSDAARLPLPDGIATTVVACMCLQDVDDLDGTSSEASRVLIPRGHLCVAIVHPFASAQDPSTMHSESPNVSEPYLTERRYEDHLEREGLEMTFVSMHRPLSTYISAMSRSGFQLSVLREFGRKPIPWLLVARLEKVGAAAGGSP